MTECRKVKELTKEFLAKLSKIQAFKERIISLKSNNNYESKRIRVKNISNNLLNEDTKIGTAVTPLSFSDKLYMNSSINKQKKLPHLHNSILVKNKKPANQDINIKTLERKNNKIKSPKVKLLEKEINKIKLNEEEKGNNQNKKEEKKDQTKEQLKTNEEPEKKIRKVSKIDDELYERLLKKAKSPRMAQSESPEPRLLSLGNNNTTSRNNKILSTGEQDKSKKNTIKKKLPTLYKEIKYQYCVYPGNYGKLIEKIMEKRSNKWVKTDVELSKYCDFIWSPLPNVIDFNYAEEKKVFVNHFEFPSNFSNKLNLYYNLFRHCESKKINLFDYFPFSICFSVEQSSYLTQIENFMKFCAELKNYTPKSEVKYIEKFNILGSRKTGEVQTINIPKTYNTGRNMWIIKPINLNRGRCIQVFNDTDKIVDYLFKIQENKQLETEDNNNFKCQHIIVQKYLEKPLLYQGRKFDIRIWILMISGQENYVYIFKQGHLKATSAEYDINSQSPFIHLTNYSIQKHDLLFSTKEIGNEISYKEFQDELDKTNSKINFMKDIYPKIVYIIRLAIGSGKNNINRMNRSNCFEIYGCDFILDEKYKPYLLEININPGLEISSPLISKLVPRMVDDALKLTIDKKWNKKENEEMNDSLFHVDGYDDNVNMWEKFSVI